MPATETSTATLHTRIKAGVVALLRSLTFTDLHGGVNDEAVLEDTNFERPCWVVSVEGEQEEIIGGTTNSRMIAYPVRVFLLATDMEMPTDAAKLQEWRATAMDAFDRRQRTATITSVLDGCTEVYATRVIPRVIFDERLKQYRNVISGFVVKAEASVARAG
jgi:hypothetical protein